MEAALEEAVPEGESPDAYSSTAAQDCWICADIPVRVMAQPDHRAGTGIACALEPLVQMETERLHGVTDVGSGPFENDQREDVLRSPRVATAFEFCDWATDLLAGRDGLTSVELDELRSRASAIAP